MKLSVVFAQTEQGLKDDLMPAAVLCWDAYCIENNPDGFSAELKAVEENKDYVRVRIVNIEVPGDPIRELLNGMPTVEGKILEERSSSVTDLYKGRKARIKPEAWARYLEKEGFDPETKQLKKNWIEHIRGGWVQMAWPLYAFSEEDIEPHDWEDV